MTNCTDTIAVRPFEAAAIRLSRGILRAARVGDQIASAAVSVLLEWRYRASQRDVLRSLDDRMLKDVGLSRADLERELRKPFWR